jgi:hypothetical protein
MALVINETFMKKVNKFEYIGVGRKTTKQNGKKEFYFN